MAIKKNEKYTMKNIHMNKTVKMFSVLMSVILLYSCGKQDSSSSKLDAKKKELNWQCVGEGILTQNVNKKEERITEFVKKILAKYPPEIKK